MWYGGSFFNISSDINVAAGVCAADVSIYLVFLLWHLFSIFLKIDPRPAAAGLQSYSERGEGGGLPVVGYGYWVVGVSVVGVVDDQHRSEDLRIFCI